MSRSWSIYSRKEITQSYEILERVGSGAYSDVYKARRISDDLIVALKEIHDCQSAFREIESLQILQNSPNVVVLHEYFWREDENAVLVLEFLQTDLASVIRDGKKNREGGVPVGEAKRWMIQILQGVDACHRNSIVHRDLKPSNLLIGSDGVLKLADFGQSRILLPEPPTVIPAADNPQGQYIQDKISVYQEADVIPEVEISCLHGPENQKQEPRPIPEEEGCFLGGQGLQDNASVDDPDKQLRYHDGDMSCLATCTTSNLEDDPFKNSYSYEAEDGGENEFGSFTSCVGTRWFRAPELLYGSTNYGQEIDLWSLGCIFAELLTLETLFPGTSDIDQLGRIINTLGNITEETWPDCSKLPDYGKIFFNNVDLLGLEVCLPNCSATEISLVKKLICYDPMSRATPMELLSDRYFAEEPLPVPINELRVPSTINGQDENSPGNSCAYQDFDSDSDLEFGEGFGVSTTDKGFSIRFS